MSIIRSAVVAALALALGLGAVFGASQAFYTYVLMWVCIHALLAVSMRLVMLVGEVNLATAAFYGLGAYGTAFAMTTLGWHVFVAIALGIFVAMVVAVAFGATTFHTTGAYFLLISFAFTEVMRMSYSRVAALGGNDGIVGIHSGLTWFRAVIVVATVVTVFLLWWLESSRWGIVMRATEGHDGLVEALGFNTHHVKTAVLAVASGVAGLAGGLYANLNTVISPLDFGFIVSILAVAWVIVGGHRHILGAVLGAGLLTVLSEEVRAVGEYEHLVYGVTLILVMVLFREGIWGLGARAVNAVRGRRSDRPPPSGARTTEVEGVA